MGICEGDSNFILNDPDSHATHIQGAILANDLLNSKN